MCSQTHLLGIVLMSFGLGLLFGLWIEAGFVAYCVGGGLIVLGFCTNKRK